MLRFEFEDVFDAAVIEPAEVTGEAVADPCPGKVCCDQLGGGFAVAAGVGAEIANQMAPDLGDFRLNDPSDQAFSTETVSPFGQNVRVHYVFGDLAA